MLPQCRALAVAHVDLMFHVFCQLGHGVGLDAAAKGMGLAGKTKGMNGAACSRAVGGGEAGGGIAVRRPGRADDTGSGDGLRSPWGASLGRPERKGAFNGIA